MKTIHLPFYFKDKSSPSGEHPLIILDDQHQPVEKGTILAVYTPLVSGRNVSPWPRLTNSFYLDEWSQEVSLSKNVKAWTLRATHHELPRHQQSTDLAPLRTLGRSIVGGDAKWDGDFRFTGEFHYTKGYWEWIEDVLSRCEKKLRLINVYDAVYASLFTYDHNSDIIKAFCEAWCPLTNTLLTSAGELSISLWDLHDLAGLPVMGCLYDEVVPSALELTGADEKGGADDDRCSNVSIDKWVKFWSKKTIKYHLPPPRKEKKTVRPRSTHNPLGDITTHKRWSIAEEALFEKLCIEGNLKEEVYLAAYLACWLCTFVLPGKDANSIRPSTFKMASMMANGRRVSLAIPLARIYEGLNTLASSPRPARTNPSFPVHFVYAWLASYFKTHYPVWQGLRGLKMTIFSGEGGAKPFKFVDNTDAEELDHNFFVAIRSSYLTLRQGDKFIIEPYSPHRFGHQFGYFQDVPGTLKYDTCAASLEEGLCYWRLCILSKSSSKAWLPGLPTNTKKFCSEAYKAWWAKVHGTFLDDNTTCLISPKLPKIILKCKKHGDNQVHGGENNPSPVPVPPIMVKSNSQAEVVEKGKGFSHNLADSDSSNKDRHWKRQKKELTPLKVVEACASRSPSADFVAQLEDEIQSIDANEESETSHSWTTTPPPPFGMALNGKQLPQPPAVSVFEGESFLFNHQKEFLQKLWSDLLVKISNTPVDFLSSIEDDVYLILESMKSFQKFDITKVEESLNTFFVKVRAYDEARSLSSHKLSRSLHAQRLKEAEDRLQDVEAKASEGVSKAQSIMDELEEVEKGIVALKGRRTSLCAALKGQKQLNHDAQAKVNEVKENVATLKNTAPLDDAIVADLGSSKANIEDLKEDLKSLNPFA
ncbi:UNVERIFIED_CONTAM: hypothetical protein Sradi_1501300 [Sesamum radiatum]|uniref:Aminotransferase-like plant mobile domain-containing protein n=1 Tax=Sesamum radiatum TaxID=300843 RepID=A0AAW2UB49_SESRA